MLRTSRLLKVSREQDLVIPGFAWNLVPLRWCIWSGEIPGWGRE